MASSTVGRGTAVVALTLAGLAATAAPAGAAAGPTSTAPHALARPAVTAHPGPASTVVGWSPPSDDGGAPITGYTATATDHTDAARGHQTCVVGTVTGVTASTPAYTGPDSCVVRGLTPGDTYTFTVTATNVVGTSGPSAPSPPVVPTGSVDPDPGYWLVGSDGGIFCFGSAGFYGSTGALPLQRPVVGMVPTADHGGYWQVASDGGVFAFGDAGFHGSIPGWASGRPGSGPGPISTHRWWPSCRRSTAAATSWWRPTAACSPSGMPPSPGRARASAAARGGRGRPARRHRCRLLARHLGR